MSGATRQPCDVRDSVAEMSTESLLFQTAMTDAYGGEVADLIDWELDREMRHELASRGVEW